MIKITIEADGLTKTMTGDMLIGTILSNTEPTGSSFILSEAAVPEMAENACFQLDMLKAVLTDQLFPKKGCASEPKPSPAGDEFPSFIKELFEEVFGLGKE